MSTEKRVRFQETGEEDEVESKPGSAPFGKKFKHSLDSDEEDDEVDYEKYNALDPSEFQDGDKESHARVEDDIKFTAFNMNEEMEEGHFDKDGTYIFRKDKDEIKDAWVQDIDNCKIADVSKIQQPESDEDSKDASPVNTTSIYRKMLTMMEKNETVGKAIRRIGLSIKEMRTKKRKDKSSQLSENISSTTKKLDQLTELADQLVIGKDMDIYEKKYEQIEELINERESDMFADD
ncbi:CD2 antigen cytoplasmic tail-binding protein 2 homolog [Panonychus citri]|uniref:CD2 antigen cytoplasmic tail-binding protein 2 homolog n=1 Tax=Panonychus citri TaxID=50023 RepID=UPI0023074D25|nr:CD2 antigen cytoplasmic tail-binding protein 2 homolog [Panonychus citri]